MLKRKTMRRTEWNGIEKRRYAVMPFEQDGLRGRMGLLYMDEVAAPFSVTIGGAHRIITHTGYSWLQIAPEDRHFWMTVMFDDAGQPIECYVDVTLENHLPENADAWFIDLFLDLVLEPNGRAALLDADELDAALAQNEITAADHAMAHAEIGRLLKTLVPQAASFFCACARARAALLPLLKSDVSAPSSADSALPFV